MRAALVEKVHVLDDGFHRIDGRRGATFGIRGSGGPGRRSAGKREQAPRGQQGGGQRMGGARVQFGTGKAGGVLEKIWRLYLPMETRAVGGAPVATTCAAPTPPKSPE